VQSDGRRGVEFKYSKSAYYWLIALLAMTIGVLLFVVAAAAAAGSVTGLVTAAIVAVLATLLGWITVKFVRLMPGVVIVSPDGVFHRGLTSAHFVPWDAIFGVAAIWPEVPYIVVQAYTAHGSRMDRPPGRLHSGEKYFLPSIAINTKWLATNPLLVSHALAFYCAYSDLRTELGSTAALDRINSRAFRIDR
jgi:ABC-type amino acid transport system permease subunit